MKYGPFLDKNKTIYLTSPSFGCQTSPYKERLDMAISHYKDLRLNVIEGPYIRNEGLLTSTPNNVAGDFIKAYKTADLIQSVGGGEIMISILPYIDFNLIKSLPPKFFMGYSDNTILTFLLPTICDIASIYGGCTPEFGSEKLIDYQYDQLDLIMGKKKKFSGYPKYEIESLKSIDNPYVNLNLTEDSIITAYPNNNISVSGRIIGGCIDVISTLIGTPYDNIKEFSNKYDNILWFFESCDMTPLEVYRRLIQMKMAGWFNKANAFLFGRPIHKENMFNKSYKDLIIDALGDFNIPIVFDLDIGHVKPQIPVIVGSIASIDVKKGKYKIKYELK